MIMGMRLVLATAILLGLAACGKKGDVKPPARGEAFLSISAPFLADFSPFFDH